VQHTGSAESIFVVENLREYESIFETVLAHESVNSEVLFDEKDQRSKISWDCPLNAATSFVSVYLCIMGNL
jgi:hypothetical protein